MIRHGYEVAQIGLALLVLMLIAFAPPARGAMLIVSLKGEGTGQIMRWAIDQGAVPLGAGPLRNSLVVVGSRSALLGASLHHGGLLLTGAFAGCGEGKAQ